MASHHLAVTIYDLEPDWVKEVAERAHHNGIDASTQLELLFQEWLTKRLLAEDNPQVRVEVRQVA